MPEFRAAVLGRGCGDLRTLPFKTYNFPEEEGWGQGRIESVWNDFSGGEHGIIMTTDDLSRRGWFANPAQYGSLANFLGEGRSFRKWGYTPVDSTGPDGHSLGVEMREAALGYDRLLAASEWGRNVLRNSGRADADWLPHGIDHKTFSPDLKAKAKLGWKENEVWVGMNAANQPRKDFPVAFHAISLLKQKYGNRLHFWQHTDLPVRAWNIYALASDYGIGDCMEVTMQATDEELALRYSACDCTILPSGGEGFSYTTAESMACGTAQIVADYAAAQELVEEDCRVKPVAMRLDSPHNVMRAVLSGHGFANAAAVQIERKRQDAEYRGEELRESVRHLGWDRLRVVWERWIRQGLK